MADQTDLLDQIAQMFRASPIARRDLEYTLPISTTDAVLSNLHQVRRLRAVSTKKTDLTIVLELHQFERVSHDEPVPADNLDPQLVSYLNDGVFDFRRQHPGGRAKFTRPDGTAYRPARYLLQPTFSRERLADPDPKKEEEHLRKLDSMRDRRPTLFSFSWHRLLKTLESGQLGIDLRGYDRQAHLYQAIRSSEDETNVLLAALPHMPKLERDPHGCAELNRSTAGVAVLLSPAFVANLLYLLRDAKVAEDGINTARSYYVRRPRQDAAALRHRIAELENDLAETRKRLSEIDPAAEDAEDNETED